MQTNITNKFSFKEWFFAINGGGFILVIRSFYSSSIMSLNS
jgi:hypothetical protein